MNKKDYKALTPKTDKGTYIIRISDYYPNNCSEQKYAEVSEEVIDYLIFKKREEKNMKEKDYRTLTSFGFDEVETGEMCAVFSVSAAEDYFSLELTRALKMAMQAISPSFRKRFYLYYVVGLTLEQVAKTEKVSHTAVLKSLRSSTEILRDVLCNNTNFEVD